MNVLKMAWRNVWRNRRRTLVTVGAMTLALFVEIHHTSLIKGYLANMEHNILDLEMGEIQIHAEGYLDDPSIYSQVDDPEQIIGELEKKGFRGSPRLLGAGLGAAGDASAGVIFRGVDPVGDLEVSSVGTHVALGRWLDRGDPSGVVIGRKLARTLAITTGDEIVVLTQGADGSMANELFRVRGILKAVGDGVDRGGIYMLDTAFRELFVLPSGAHQIIVRTPAGADLDSSRRTVAALAPGRDVKSWKQLNPTIATMLESTEGVMITMYMVFFLAVGIVILNAMLMAVFERIREFGVLKAIGMGPGGVMRLIIVESGVQTAIAIVAGCLLSVPTLWLLWKHGMDMSALGGGMAIAGVAMDPIWKAVITPDIFTGPIFALVFIVSMAILYPALKAALIKPVEAITHS